MKNEVIFKTKILARLVSKSVGRILVGITLSSFVIMIFTKLFYDYLIKVLPEHFVIVLGASSAIIFFFITMWALFQKNKKNFIGTLVLNDSEILAQTKDLGAIHKVLEKGDKIRISYTGYNQEKVQGERETGQQNWLYFNSSDDLKKIEFYIDTEKHKNQLIRVLEAWYDQGIEVEETKGGIKSYLLEAPKRGILSLFKKGKDK